MLPVSTEDVQNHDYFIWAATRQNQQSDCAPSEDSDQSLRCPHEENLGP